MCLALPGATHSVQWGDDHVYKVGGKMFAAHDSAGRAISFKCDPAVFELLVESGVARPAPYLARAKWVQVSVSDMPPEELGARLRNAYALIRGRLTRAAQAALPPFEG